MDRVSVEKRSKIMRSIKSKNTKPELMVKSVLVGGFESQYKLAGNADFAYVREKVAVFVDGDFWHGKDFEEKSKKYNEHWKNHIQGNIDRDKRVRSSLKKSGWKVLSFWESDIYKKLDVIGEKISSCVFGRRDNPPSNYQDYLF